MWLTYKVSSFVEQWVYKSINPFETRDIYPNYRTHQRLLRSTVRIETEANLGVAFGNGFIISSDGYVATAAHVVEDIQTAWIILSNDDVYRGTVVAIRPEHDCAILKIDALYQLSSVRFGSSRTVRLGQVLRICGWDPSPIAWYKHWQGSTRTPDILQAPVSSIIYPTENESYPMLKLQMASKHGLSGSPVFSPWSGRILGLLSGGRHTVEYPVTEVIPVEILKALASDHKIKLYSKNTALPRASREARLRVRSVNTLNYVIDLAKDEPDYFSNSDKFKDHYDYFSGSIRDWPEWLPPLLLRSALCYRNGRFDEAIEDAMQVLSFNPSCVPAWNGFCWAIEGKASKTLEGSAIEIPSELTKEIHAILLLCKEADSLRPSNTINRAWFDLILCELTLLVRLNQFEDVVAKAQWFRNLVQFPIGVEDDEPTLISKLAEVMELECFMLLRLDRTDAALETAYQALKNCPSECASIFSSISIALEKQLRNSDALKFWDALIEVHDSASARLNRCSLLFRNGNSDLAQSDAEFALDCLCKKPGAIADNQVEVERAHLLLAQLLLSKGGSPQQALCHIQKIDVSSSNAVLCRLLRSIAYIESGHPDLAVLELKKESIENPKVLPNYVQHALSYAYAQMNENYKAQYHYSEAVKHSGSWNTPMGSMNGYYPITYIANVCKWPGLFVALLD